MTLAGARLPCRSCLIPRLLLPPPCCSGILTPAVAPPAFTRLQAVNATIDEQQGTFSVGLTAGLDRPGQVFYAVYR